MKPNQKVAMLALAAFVTGTSLAAITGKSSGFMNKSQLAEWRAETVLKSAGTKQEDPAFFTGRPYLEATETYAYKFRAYDPNVARWTSEDPSGFPDGANNALYVNNWFLSAINPDGLDTKNIQSSLEKTLIINRMTQVIESKQGWGAELIARITVDTLLEIEKFEPVYNGIYQWDTTAHTLMTRGNPGQTGISGAGIKTDGIVLNFAVEFKFFLPNPEQRINPANNNREWNYKGEGFWMLNVTGSVQGSWELLRPDTTKLNEWSE